VLTHPVRLVSLVPCITYTLLRLGGADRLVGATRYCPLAGNALPRGRRELPSAPFAAEVGGIHDIGFDLLASLTPDLVLADPDENGRANLERLAREFPLERVQVRSVEDSLSFLGRMGSLLGAEEAAGELVRRFLRPTAPLGEIPLLPSRRSVAALVWKDPWIAAGAGTYASAILEHRGQRNCVTQPGYPQVGLADLLSLRPDVVLLPSEPYDFTSRDEDDLRALFQAAGTVVERVDGRDLVWYGAWMAEAYR
jgi:ABC-type Fe3+-hydroxamate transport system substrate-binding protein